MQIAQELALFADADARAARYLSGIADMRVFPDDAALAVLGRFDEALPQQGHDPHETLALLDDVGSPATAVSNGPRYFGFVIGAAHPAAAAAERLAMAWDQCASSFDNAPAAATIEAVASRWLLDILDLPRRMWNPETLEAHALDWTLYEKFAQAASKAAGAPQA